MRALSKKPAVYQSLQTSRATHKSMTAVTWVKVDPASVHDLGFCGLEAAWRKGRDESSGYISWDDLAKFTRLEVYHLASLVKTIWLHDRDSASFSINRMGDGVYVRLNKPELFQPVPLPEHWTSKP